MTWTLHLGDCLDPESGLASLPAESVDHVICDPPYEAEAHTKQRRAALGPGHGLSKVEEKPLDFEPITDRQRALVALHLARIARRWILVFCQAEAVGVWRDRLVEARAVFKRACIWVKPDGQPQLTGDRPAMGYESIVAAHAPGRSRWNGGGKTGVYTFNRYEGDGPHAHPTQKPAALMEALVRDFTDPGELIVDPFAGSGSTGVAAIRQGRTFVGWEKDPKYYAVAARRLGASREQLGLVLERPRKAKQESLL